MTFAIPLSFTKLNDKSVFPFVIPATFSPRESG